VRHASLAPDPASAENVVRVVLADGVRVDLESLRRNLYASSSCGICGKATLDNALATAPPLEDPARFAPDFFYALPERLARAQVTFAETGGVHGAALFDPRGGLVVAREDVGRHNAVDKVVGWAVLNDRLPLRGVVLQVSGRASFELVQKAVMAGIPILAAVSAPSSLAVELAAASGLTLIGFLRGQSMNIYTRDERIVDERSVPADRQTVGSAQS